jgi:hypothetical protein
MQAAMVVATVAHQDQCRVHRAVEAQAAMLAMAGMAAATKVERAALAAVVAVAAAVEVLEPQQTLQAAPAVAPAFSVRALTEAVVAAMVRATVAEAAAGVAPMRGSMARWLRSDLTVVTTAAEVVVARLAMAVMVPAEPVEFYGDQDQQPEPFQAPWLRPAIRSLVMMS